MSHAYSSSPTAMLVSLTGTPASSTGWSLDTQKELHNQHCHLLMSVFLAALHVLGRPKSDIKKRVKETVRETVFAEAMLFFYCKEPFDNKLGANIRKGERK